jgi:acetoin utilization protein AcuB
MLVKYWMSPDVVTINPDSSLVEAAELLKEKRIRRLCVVKGKKLIGIVTDADLKEASPSDATTLSIHEMAYLLSKVKIKDIMTKKPITIEVDKAIDDAAVVMLKNRLSSLPVMDKKHLVGIITESDIFKALVALTGVHQKGVQFGFELEDKSGTIKDVGDIIRSHGGRMVSILTSYEDAREGFRNVYIRVKGLGAKKMKDLQDELNRRFRVFYTQGGGKK